MGELSAGRLLQDPGQADGDGSRVDPWECSECGCILKGEATEFHEGVCAGRKTENGDEDGDAGNESGEGARPDEIRSVGHVKFEMFIRHVRGEVERRRMDGSGVQRRSLG